MSAHKNTPQTFPVKFLSIAFAWGVVSLLFLGWQSWHAYHNFKTVQMRSFRLQELCGIIFHLDDELTMSARNCAFTKDFQWEERYNRYEPQLDAAIRELKRTAPEAVMNGFASVTDAANIKLVEMERRAFELAHQGRMEDGVSLLFSKAYTEQKMIYSDGMEQFARLVQKHVETTTGRYRLHAFVSVAIAGIALAVLIAVSLYTLQRIRRYFVEKAHADEKIRKLSTVIEQSPICTYITDKKGSIEYVNPMFEKVTGYTCSEVMGQNPRILGCGEIAAPVFKGLWDTLLGGGVWKDAIKNRRKNGETYWCKCTHSPIFDDRSGDVTNFVAMQEDITETVKMEEDIRHLSMYTSYDMLTGLLNRTRFRELLEGWMSYAKTRNYTGVILLLDIDRFRLINDTYGSRVGDDLLRAVAGFLTEVVSDIDMQYYRDKPDKEIMESTLCRLGGDEFAALLPGRDEGEGAASAEEIRRRFESFQCPGIPGHITVTVGVVVYPKHGDTFYDLFKKVDATVYHAKESGRNVAHVFQPEYLLVEKMLTRVEEKAHIQNALKGGRFEPWFQPIMSLKDGAIHHFEALARMKRDDGTIAPPALFIDTAAAFGLVKDVDKVITEKAMRAISGLCKQGMCISVSVNISGKEFGDRELLEFLKVKMSETGVAAAQIVFEITETAAIQELTRAVAFIKDLRLLGCRFSLDDFGVGFTSFRYLKELEVNFIKIDGSFIRQLSESRSDRIFVKSMVDVAKGLGIQTIAEFVENKETVEILKELGVDYAQGYFIGKPTPDILKGGIS